MENREEVKLAAQAVGNEAGNASGKSNIIFFITFTIFSFFTITFFLNN